MRACLCLVLIVLATGCAARSAGPVDTQRVKEGAQPDRSLATFVAKVRALSTEAAARPPRVGGATLEGSDMRLAAALALAASTATAATLREVAEAYGARGVFDKAHEYLQAALRLDPRDPATYEAQARLWRDARLPHLALSDAYRATYFAPDWAVAHNTLGTVMQALGQRVRARAAYARALQLDPSAAYALNNLCYGWMLDGQTRRAVADCLEALRLDPGLRAARNNLGLAHAAAGNMEAAAESFRAAGDEPGALFNLGIAHLARREYRSAVEAFETAHALRPSLTLARARARQARTGTGEGPPQ